MIGSFTEAVWQIQARLFLWDLFGSVWFGEPTLRQKRLMALKAFPRDPRKETERFRVYLKELNRMLKGADRGPCDEWERKTQGGKIPNRDAGLLGVSKEDSIWQQLLDEAPVRFCSR